MANSFPSVVGDAGCPCVRLIIGVAASVSAISAIFEMMSSISGVVAAIPERSMSAWERLLMSSDVHAKWTNSVTAWSSWF